MVEKKDTVILVCGGRDYSERKKLFQELDLISYKNNIVRVIHGGAPGADSFAGEWANHNNINCDIFKPEWNVYGKAAGPIRNSIMLKKLKSYQEEGRNCFVVAFPGGHGTSDMVKRSEKAGFKIIKPA